MIKPLKIAAISGIIFIVFVISYLPFAIIFTFIYNFLLIFKNPIANFISILFSILLFIWILLFAIYIYGFVELGRKLKSKFLFYNSLVLEIFISFFIIILLIGISTGFITIHSFGSGSEALGFLIFGLIIIFYGIYSIIFGISLTKLKNEGNNLSTIGTLNIIAGITYLIGIGFIIRFVSMFFEIKSLLIFSKKFEK